MYLLKGGNWWSSTVSNVDSTTRAIALAKADCEAKARKESRDPNDCVPVAVNDQQIFDPSGIYQNQAQQQAADAAAFQSIQNSVQSIGNSVSNLRHR
jgi:hypothetical protein